MELLCDEGELVRIGPHYFHRASLDRARSELVKNARGNGGEVAIPALRDTLATSRKFMIPLLEHFDGKGITVRRGDKRFLRESQVR
jgi:selenocysteine-specific elongation factor